MLDKKNVFVSPDEREYLYLLIENKKFDDILSFIKSKSDSDLNFTTEDGNTLLHLIIKNCDKEKDNGKVLAITQLLLINGLSHTAINSKFKTPLDYAKESNNTPVMGLFNGFPVEID